MALKPVSGNIQEEMNNIPLADDDPQGIPSVFLETIDTFLMTCPMVRILNQSTLNI